MLRAFVTLLLTGATCWANFRLFTRLRSLVLLDLEGKIRTTLLQSNLCNISYFCLNLVKERPVSRRGPLAAVAHHVDLDISTAMKQYINSGAELSVL
ncbi:hypothetical protein CPB83DRAFT_583790 [Crepidotus variabilis]|uniref:Uncharacterized protein n=1 Tax=Crepidotus variabilis TaxID=179855 RepID=A0A9P6JT81_9AGAR|nr:hypothetical protein CPB83DRAFT_583790 [Crepidotus variabilis]